MVYLEGGGGGGGDDDDKVYNAIIIPDAFHECENVPLCRKRQVCLNPKYKPGSKDFVRNSDFSVLVGKFALYVEEFV
jgi:hypothetical protein